MSNHSESDPGEQPKRPIAYWAMLLLIIIYMALALLILRHPNDADPWARLDWFSGGYLVLSILMAVHVMNLNRKILKSKEVMSEFFGTTFDPVMGIGTVLLGLAELAVLADYSHWRLLPVLESATAQTIGLSLYALSFVWMVWTDVYLGRHFVASMDNRAVLRDGPYQWIRHPRYLSLLVNRFSFALTLASPVGWVIAVLWAILIFRRIKLEEIHLRKLFGDAYAAYSQATARLVPHLF